MVDGQPRISTALDFWQALPFENCFGPSESLNLTIGGKRMTCLVRRPYMIAWTKAGLPLPDNQKPELPDPEAPRVILAPDFQAEKAAEEIKNTKAWYRMLVWMFESPQMSLLPQLSFIHPQMLSVEDHIFLMGWTKGLVASDGRDLETFRSRYLGGAGGDGGTVRLPSEPAFVADGGAVADRPGCSDRALEGEGEGEEDGRLAPQPQ